MSTCISRHGEYGSHVLSAGTVEDRFVCARCSVLMEDDLMDALDLAEKRLRAVEAACNPECDPIIGARQAAEAGPSQLAPIVIWSYLAALVKEYDKLRAALAVQPEESANPDCAPSGAESGSLPTANAAGGTSVVQPEDGGE